MEKNNKWSHASTEILHGWVGFQLLLPARRMKDQLWSQLGNRSWLQRALGHALGSAWPALFHDSSLVLSVWHAVSANWPGLVLTALGALWAWSRHCSPSSQGMRSYFGWNSSSAGPPFTEWAVGDAGCPCRDMRLAGSSTASRLWAGHGEELKARFAGWSKAWWFRACHLAAMCCLTFTNRCKGPVSNAWGKIKQRDFSSPNRPAANLAGSMEVRLNVGLHI